MWRRPISISSFLNLDTSDVPVSQPTSVGLQPAQLCLPSDSITESGLLGPPLSPYPMRQIVCLLIEFAPLAPYTMRPIVCLLTEFAPLAPYPMRRIALSAPLAPYPMRRIALSVCLLHLTKEHLSVEQTQLKDGPGYSEKSYKCFPAQDKSYYLTVQRVGRDLTRKVSPKIQLSIEPPRVASGVAPAVVALGIVLVMSMAVVVVMSLGVASLLVVAAAAAPRRLLFFLDIFFL